jgi:hypothetical protein
MRATSFYLWTGVDVPRKAIYKGTLSGDEIKFAFTGGVAGQGGESGPQQLVAKRAK